MYNRTENVYNTHIESMFNLQGVKISIHMNLL